MTCAWILQEPAPKRKMNAQLTSNSFTRSADRRNLTGFSECFFWGGGGEGGGLGELHTSECFFFGGGGSR